MIISSLKILFFTEKKYENENLDFLKTLFQNYETKILSAFTIQKAVEIINEECIYLLISDIKENLNSFFSLIKKCKNLTTGKRIYTLYLTDNDDENFLLDLYEHNIAEIFSLKTSVKLLQARANSLANHIIQCSEHHHPKELIFDKDLFVVKKGSEILSLTKKEFDILKLLSSEPHKTFSREEIYKKIWGNKIIVSDRTLDVHIRKIRSKIGVDFIETYKGIGYKFIAR